MGTSLKLLRTAAAALALSIAALVVASADDRASPGDVARFVAGMQPSAGSPLAPLTRERGWQVHANHFDRAWKALEQRQLDPIAAWQKRHLPDHSDLMLYLFSGPDYLYANAFFPHASTYILTGLEPVGDVPSVSNMGAGTRAYSLQTLRASMQTIVNISFFITKKMQSQLRAGELTGTLPVIYVFLARAGKTVKSIDLITLKTDGTIVPQFASRERHDAPGARITFSGRDGVTRTLYYFRTDLSNVGMKYSGLTKFVDSLGAADSLVKSASYLLHSGSFKAARELLFEKSARILQDDSGIPLRYFDKENWDFKPFGYYLGPIEIFSGQYQRDMQRLFSRQNTTPINFGFGYKWRRNQSNVLLATQKVMPRSEAEKNPEAGNETPSVTEAMTDPADDATRDATDSAMADPAEGQGVAQETTDEATPDPEELAAEDTGDAMSEPADAPADEASGNASDSPGSVTTDGAADGAGDTSDQSSNGTDAMPEVDVAAVSTCREACASAYEPCRQNADDHVESCFGGQAEGDCLTVWEVEAGQCIAERLKCARQCR